MNREIQVGILLMVSLMWECPAFGQEIHIRVVNAHNGKPITNECANVWIGPPHGAGLIAPTNKDGVVVLHLARNEVTADSVFASRATELPFLAPNRCRKTATRLLSRVTST